jgi:hypothetical protein
VGRNLGGLELPSGYGAEYFFAFRYVFDLVWDSGAPMALVDITIDENIVVLCLCWQRERYRGIIHCNVSA